MFLEPFISHLYFESSVSRILFIPHFSTRVLFLVCCCSPAYIQLYCVSFISRMLFTSNIYAIVIAALHIPMLLPGKQELFISPWWRNQMETFSVLLVLCVGNSPVTSEFPAQRPVTRSFEIFFDLPEHTIEQTTEAPIIWDTIVIIMTPLLWQTKVNNPSDYGYP